MKREFSLFVALLYCVHLFANTRVEVDGITYEIWDSYRPFKEAIVVKNANYDNYLGDSNYSGNIIIPDSFYYNGEECRVTEIGFQAFFGCKDLKSVTLPKDIIKISDEAFARSGISSITFPNRLSEWDREHSIGMSAFASCRNLRKLTIPEGITKFCYDAFFGSGLESITLPSSLKEIESYAFGDISLLKVRFNSLVPPAITSNFDQAGFDTFTNVLEVPVEGLQSYKNSDYWGNFSKILGVKTLNGIRYGFDGSENVTVLASDVPYKGDIIIPSEIEVNSENYKITSISDGAFKECKDLTGVVLPTQLTSIGTGAFMETAYWNNQPDGLIYNGNYLLGYKGYNNDGAIHIKEGTTLIANDALYGADFSSIILPNSLMYIGEWAFNRCLFLESINIPNNVRTIREFTFDGCSSLTSVVLPSSLNTLERNAFSDCYALRSLTLPSNLKIIGSGAFAYCTNLASIILPTQLTSIGTGAFMETAYWNNQPDGLIYNGNYLLGYKGEKSNLKGHVEIKEGTTLIANSALTNLSQITSMSFPYGLKFIGDYAIGHCSNVAYISFSKDLKAIGLNAFDGCTSLNSVTMVSANPPSMLTDYERACFSSSAKLLVPKGALNAYKSSSYWKKFAQIEEYQQKITLDDSKTYENVQEDIHFADIKYVRNFKNTDWQALYIPFGMKYDDWYADFDIARLNNIHQYDYDNDGVIDRTVLEFFILPEQSCIEPNISYLIRAKEIGEKVLNINDALLKTAENSSIDCSSVDYHYIFTGTYQGITGDEMFNNKYYALAPGGLKQAANNKAKLGAFRWYLSVEDRHSVKESLPQTLYLHVIDESGNVTEICDVNLEQANKKHIWPANIYNTKGQLVKAGAQSLDEVPNGLYIVNGKKIIK